MLPCTRTVAWLSAPDSPVFLQAVCAVCVCVCHPKSRKSVVCTAGLSAALCPLRRKSSCSLGRLPGWLRALLLPLLVCVVRPWGAAVMQGASGGVVFCEVATAVGRVCGLLTPSRRLLRLQTVLCWAKACAQAAQGVVVAWRVGYLSCTPSAGKWSYTCCVQGRTLGQ